MPKQDAIVDTISENLEELRTLLDDRRFTAEDFAEEENLINNIEILLMQLRWKITLNTLMKCQTMYA